MTRQTLLALALFAGTAAAAPPRVIYSEIPGDPTSVCPGTGGLAFTALLDLHASFDGNWWIFKGFIDDPENDVVVYGFGTDGANGTLAAWEAMDSGLGNGTSHNFLDSDCGINDNGRYAFGSRLDGATSLTDEVIIANDGSGAHYAAFLESELAPGLTDTGPAGDEVFGNSLNSPSVLNDGTVNVKADQIENVDNAFESALYIGSTPVAQEGTMGPGGQTYGGFTGLGGNTFDTSASGSDWIIEADVDPSALSTVEAVVVNGFVEVQDGDSLGEGTVDNVFGIRMSATGGWMARGDFTDDNDWVVIQTPALRANLLVQTGDPITTGNAELWANAIGGINLNAAGDWVISGNTSNPDVDADTVMVVNSQTVIAREGDPVDLDGDGDTGDDDAELAGFSPNDLAFNPDGDVIAFVTLRRTSTGAALGDAFVVIDVPAEACSFADCDASGSLNVDDIDCFAAGFFGGDLDAADCDDNGVLNVDDIDCFAAAFLAGCA